MKLAIEGGCNAVASTLGVLGSVARQYAHKIPFIVKLNHNEFISYPNSFDQIRFGSVKQAWDMGAAGVGATIYFVPSALWDQSRGQQHRRGDRGDRHPGRPPGPGAREPKEHQVMDSDPALAKDRREREAGNLE